MSVVYLKQQAHFIRLQEKYPTMTNHINYTKEMGEINSNNIFYLTKYIKILSPQHVTNIKIFYFWG